MNYTINNNSWELTPNIKHKNLGLFFTKDQNEVITLHKHGDYHTMIELSNDPSWKLLTQITKEEVLILNPTINEIELVNEIINGNTSVIPTLMEKISINKDTIEV